MITQGPQAGLSAELAAGVVMIGRGADCQLILDDDYVSTRHARVIQHESSVYAEDLGSTVMGRIPILPDATGEPGNALFEEDSAPARAFDEIAAGLAATKVRRRIKVL